MSIVADGQEGPELIPRVPDAVDDLLAYKLDYSVPPEQEGVSESDVIDSNID